MKKLLHGRVLLRWVACVVVFLAVWEICARVDDHLTEGAPLLGNYDISAMLTYDAFGVVGRPYGHFGKWQLNALGYRGPDLHPATQRVLCIGASETFGMGESAGMEYPRQLERTMNSRLGSGEADSRFEIVNAAYAGQSLRSFAYRVNHIVDDLAPKMAIIYPSFLAYISNTATGSSDPVGWVQEPHGIQSRVVTKLLNSLDRMPPWAEDLRYRFHIWRAVRKAGGVVMPTIPESHVEQFRSDLRSVLDRLQQKQVRPILVTHATFFGESVDPEERYMLTAWRRFEPTLADEGWLDTERRMNAVIRQEAVQRHLPLVEAANVLSGPENFTDWVHFTNQGAHKLAELIAENLINETAVSTVRND